MIRISCYIDAGARAGEKQNDDRAAVCGTVLKEGFYTCCRPDAALFAVCDGVGGEAFGYAAAEAAAGCVAAEDGKDMDGEDLRQMILSANRAVLDIQKKAPEMSEMATTVSGLYLTGTECLCFNVGDSRVYRFLGGFLKQMTEDDKLGGHVLSKWVGMPGLEPSVRILPPPVPGCVYVACSDGVSDTLSFEEWESSLKEYADGSLSAEDLCRSLVEKAIANGSEDNCTLIIAEILSPEGERYGA